MMQYVAYEPVSTKRLHLLAQILYSLALAIFARLLYLQVFKHTDLKAMAVAQQEKLIDLREMRGTIFDSQRHPLAISVPVESVCVNPKRVLDAGTAAAILGGALHLPEKELRTKIELAKELGKGFLWIKRKLSKEEAEHLHSLRDKRTMKAGDVGAGLDWIEFRTESKRVYPNETLGAAVIGWLDAKDKGAGGLEKSLEGELESELGVAKVIKDARVDQNEGGFGAIVAREARPGKNFILTIDARIQYAAERALAKAIKESKAPAGTIVVMDPKTGNVLAMASWPAFNPNIPMRNESEAPSRWNRAITTAFEPGSVFKTITFSSGFEFTNLHPGTPINCQNGTLVLPGRVIHDTHSYSVLAAEDVYAKSSNIGSIWVARQVGSTNFYDMIHRFGFGLRTGIPLPDESRGHVWPLDRWRNGSIMSIAMGHEVLTTGLQLAQAGVAIANGGMLVKPRLIEGTQIPGGPVEKAKASESVRIMRPETAITMRKLMERVILSGTGSKAFLKTYTAGGKTGSAQIFDKASKKYIRSYNASFLGMAPLVDPAIVVVVTLNGTKPGPAGYGGEVAAPAFKEVALAALRLTEVPRDMPTNEPDIKDADTNDLAIASNDSGLLNDNDFVLASVPPPQALRAAHADAGGLRSFLTQQQQDEDVDPDQPHRAGATGPLIPNLKGKSLREVLELTSELGIEIEPSGRGLVRGQFPTPGDRLIPGEKVKVQFGQ